tara:strand:- start:124 stop:396 length:273 start_codon:yes stop_codon:yes gene_type:complete
MFIFDGTTIVVFTCILILTYGILEVSDNENFKTVQSKGITAVIVSAILTVAYAYFMSQGSETLLTDNFVDAGSKFNTVSGMDSIRTMADI